MPTATPTAQSAARDSISLTLTREEATIVHSALASGLNALALTRAAAEREITQPTNFLNPQPALWEQRVADIKTTQQSTVDIANRLGEAFDLPSLFIPEPASHVEGPGEQNRPAGANPGAASA